MRLAGFGSRIVGGVMGERISGAGGGGKTKFQGKRRAGRGVEIGETAGGCGRARRGVFGTISGRIEASIAWLGQCFAEAGIGWGEYCDFSQF